MSKFYGVSLGNNISRHMTFVRNTYLRIWQSIDMLCKKFRPTVICFHGLRTETDILDSDIIRILLADIAAIHNLEVQDIGEPGGSGAGTYPIGRFLETARSWKEQKPNKPKMVLRELYIATVAFLFMLRSSFSPKKPRVFLFLNWLGIRNLIENFDHTELTPVILVEPWPKSFSFLIKCLRKNILVSRLPKTTLNRAERQQVTEIIARFEASWESPRDSLHKAQRHFVRENYIRNGLIFERALVIKKYHLLYKKLGLDRVLVGDSESWLCSTIVELAACQDISADELLNGLFLSNQKTLNRCHRLDSAPPLSRLLSWGSVNKQWLEATDSPLPAVLTGYPALKDLYVEKSAYKGSINNALILPIIPGGDDPAALYCETFTHLVSTARLLNKLGSKNLRLKIHPGHISTKPYFEDVLRYHDIDCLVVVDGDLQEQVTWADIVVGGVNSGSCVEVLAQGKPYYPCLILPSSLDSQLFSFMPVFSSTESLERALVDGYVPDREMILEKFCSIHSIDNPVKTTWDALAQGLIS